MPPLHRCLCTFHKCKDIVDKDGNPGAMVNARTLRIHKQEDINHNLRTLATEKQQAVLSSQEASLSRTLERMTVADGSPTPGFAKPLGDQDKYRIDHIRKMVSHISEIKDGLELLRKETNSIGAPPSRVDDVVITNTLIKLGVLRNSAMEMERNLVIISRRAKAPSIASIRDEARADLKDFFVLIGGVESSWESLLSSRQAQREAELQSGAIEYDSGYHFEDVLGQARSILQLIALMVVACNVVLGLSRRGCYWLFSMVRFIIQTVLFKALGETPVSAYFRGILHGIPKDVRTATSQFHLEPKATIYAACPKCHTTYKPTITNNIPVYQERCNFRRYSSRCGELIVRPKMIRNHRINVPIRPYISYDFKDWLAGLLARAGYEEMMDGAWSRMELPPDGQLKDIFQGSTIRSFKGPDKQTHFSVAGGKDTGRYLFSLSFDSFNPLGNKIAGKKLSVGLISLVCVNLPIELRYEPENMFVAGLIPGPSEPPLDAINPYIRPIIDEFLQFWDGVRFTRTSMYELGRLILCAIIVVICDSPASRKVGGFASFGHEHFCTFCRCNKTEHSYEDIKMESWENRTNGQCRMYAERFRNATTAKAAASSFDKTGLRWSELLRLPYYDPTRFLVVDPMHTLFLGLIKEHFQGTLGYRKGNSLPTSSPLPNLHITLSDDPTNPLPEEKAPRASVRRLISWLEQPLDFSEMSQDDFDAMVTKWGKSTVHVWAFVYVGRNVGCLPPTMHINGIDTSLSPPRKATKKDLANFLLTWRRNQAPLADPPDPNISLPINEDHGRVFTTEEMETLWEDLQKIVKPTWMTSVPTTLSSSGPKLKSDQWRAVGSLYLPITLIRLWSKVDPDNEKTERRRELLHLTMLLMSAITVASSRITSVKNAEEFVKLMLEYRSELQRLFPGYEAHSIHHMAIHIGDFLLMYGPAHGWWAFPFERTIGKLQRMTTNHKPGEYEETIGRSWHRLSNFRAFFKKTCCPESLKQCFTMFDTLVRPQVGNTLAADSYGLPDDLSDNQDIDEDGSPFAGTDVPITPDIRTLLEQGSSRPPIEIPRTAQSFTHIHHQGIAYSVLKRHEGNSGVLFQGRDTPCCIERILQFPTSNNGCTLQGTWIIARPYRHAYVDVDPYAVYPRLRMRIWSVEREGFQVALPISSIDTHFAKRVIDWEDKEVAVIVSLSRVILV